MKNVVLIAGCFAVASVAAAAELKLKDPAQLAREWDATMKQANENLLPSTKLTGSKDKEPGLVSFRLDNEARRTDFFHPDQLLPKLQEIIDLAPKTDDKPHPKAKEWHYRGHKYWIVPLTA